MQKMKFLELDSALAEGSATVLLAQYQVLAATGTLTNYLEVDVFKWGEYF